MQADQHDELPEHPVTVPVPSAPQAETIALERIVDGEPDLSEKVVGAPTAYALWLTPSGGALSIRDQALVGARRLEELPEHEVVPFCRSLSGASFAALAAVGTRTLRDFNDGQLALEELLANVDPRSAFDLELRDGFRGKTTGDGERELVRAVHVRPLRGGDLWDVPAEGITVGHLAEIGARASGYASAIVQRWSAHDLGRLVGVVSAFLSPFRPTGETL